MAHEPVRIQEGTNASSESHGVAVALARTHNRRRIMHPRKAPQAKSPTQVWVETTHPSRCDQSCLTQILVDADGKGAGKQQAEMTDLYKILHKSKKHHVMLGRTMELPATASPRDAPCPIIK